MDKLKAESKRIIAAAAILVLIIVIGAATLPRYGDVAVIPEETREEGGKLHVNITDVALGRGVWTCTLLYDSDHDLLTSVVRTAGAVNRPAGVYGISNAHAFSGKSSETFTVVVPDDDVRVGAEVTCADSGAERHAAEHVREIRFTFRPGITLLYRLYRPVTAFVLAVLFYILVRMIRARKTAEEKVVLFVLPLLVIVVSAPLLINGMLRGHDTAFHLARIAHLAEGLQRGEFPVRMQAGWYRDYGAPMGICYGDLFLYPAALLYLLHLPLWKCGQLLILMINVMTVYGSYHCFRKLTGNRTVALAGTVLYATNTWYSTVAYFRCAVGELTTMSFLPFVAAGFALLLEQRNREAFRLLVTGFSGLLFSNVLITFMTGLFFALCCLVFLRRLLAEGTWKTLLQAAVCTAAVSACFLVPFLDFSVHHTITGPSFLAYNPQGKGITPAQLLLTDPPDISAANADTYRTIGPALLAVFAICVFFAITEMTDRVFRKRMLVLSALSALSLWMASAFFPYTLLEDRFPVLYGLLFGNFDYPMRWLTLTSVLLSMAGVYAAAHTMQCGERMAHATKCVLVLTAAFSLLQAARLSGVWINGAEGDNAPLMQRGFAELQGGEYAAVDGIHIYTLAGTDDSAEALLKGISVSDDALHAEQESREGLSFRLHVQNKGGGDAFLELPVWYYHGYRAAADGAPLAISDGENHRVRLSIPAGFDGTVTLAWKEPLLWRLAELLSVLSVIFLIVYEKRRGEVMPA